MGHGERGGGGGNGQTTLELLCEVHYCRYKYDLWEMAALIVRALVYGTTVGADFVSVDDKEDQEPLRDPAHVVHATLRLYGCPWEAIRLGFQLHIHKFLERNFNDDLPLNIDCASANYFSKRNNKKNASNVIESLISLHEANITVTSMNAKILLGILIVSGASRYEGVGIVLCANPATLLYENICLSGFPYIISRVATEECLTFVFQFLQDIHMVVRQEAVGETQNVDAI